MDRLGIVNKTFIKLGQLPITDLNDKDKRTVSILSIYESVRDTEQAAYRWTFCTKRTILKPLEVKIPETGETVEVKPEFGHEATYLLPDDFLRLISIENSGGANYSIEGRKLLYFKSDSLKVIMLAKQIREEVFPPAFVEAFSTRLAIELCEALQQDPSRKQGLLQEYALNLTVARKTDAIQRAHMPVPQGDWLGNRYDFIG